MGKGAILGSILVAILSWVGLGFLVTYTSPGTLTRPAFFLLLFGALMATFVPIAFYFNHRFASSESSQDSVLSPLSLGQRTRGSSKDSVRAIRQSGLAALFLVLCAWLRMIRFLNWPVAQLLLCVLGLIEVFILTRR